MNLKRTLLHVALVSALSVPAFANVIDFDSGLGNGSAIYNGYQGLNWDNFYALDTNGFTASGYVNGVVSPTFVAYNAFGSPAEITAASGKFNFLSGYFTSAWNDGLQLNVTGYSGGSQIYSTSYTLNTSGPQLLNLGFSNVDRVRFETSGGINVGYNGQGTHFALDNVSVSPTPEPETYAMMSLGMGLVSLIARRKKKDQLALAA